MYFLIKDFVKLELPFTCILANISGTEGVIKHLQISHANWKITEEKIDSQSYGLAVSLALLGSTPGIAGGIAAGAVVGVGLSLLCSGIGFGLGLRFSTTPNLILTFDPPTEEYEEFFVVQCT